MIEIQAKIHDKNTLEFKVGYVARRKLPVSEFDMNTWIFVPYSLDINPKTYFKNNFYRDVRSYVRLITPSYLLRDLVSPDILPYRLLYEACLNVTSQPTQTNLKKYESEIKMYASILKSAIRNAYVHIKNNAIDADRMFLCNEFLSNLQSILEQYRGLRKVVNVSSINNQYLSCFNYADEFISNVMEQHVYRLLNLLKNNFPADYDVLKQRMQELLDNELHYKKQMHYNYVKVDSEDNNSRFVYHASMLKKYIESDLYLAAHKRRNTFFLEQIAFSIAAGISMIFATVIAFSFQQTYGNFTLPLFIALVISYMFKDRIKELIRYYFANKLGSRFFDNRISIRVNNRKIGWSKEGFDYISNEKLPRYVWEKRGRTSPMETSRRIYEQVILYRKRVHLKRKNVKETSPHPILGVNDIIRYNLSEFMRKMDNPEMPVYANLGNGNFELVEGEKVYYLNFIIQCKYQGQSEYKRYRVCLNRKELKDIEAID